MKDLIRQIEGLKIINPEGIEIVHNNAIDKTIHLINKYPVIHCKGLRKKGEDKWYEWYPDTGKWSEIRLPKGYSAIAMYTAPADAELVDILIIEKPKTE